MTLVTSKAKSPKPLVYLGLSGGVDSAVAAALLQRAGYQVVGVFIKVWEPPGLKCTWREDRREAMRVAAHLDLPLLTLDLAQEYKRSVVDYLLREYQSGRTPNPDIMCNRSIKFGAFYDWALEQGADYVATGHYAQINKGRLERANDDNKDQTYFLWQLKLEQLGKIIFPIGRLKKAAVRRLAKQFKLPNAERPDSQGLCFVGQIDFKKFLSRQIKFQPGAVLDELGQIIGRHEGAGLYTVGERHGFVLDKQTPAESPHYIIDRDLIANTITVSDNQKHPKLTPDVIRVVSCRWLSEAPELGQKYSARIRHRGELLSCRLQSLDQDRAEFKFIKPPLAPAPGQSLVLYDGRHCLGGGIIA